jgi:Holliday junction DNA helicase RuvA
VKKALKSLVVPIKDIALAIETKDVSALSKLPGIGGRLADKIVAELHGKTAKFALSKTNEPLAVKEKTSLPFEEEAIEVLRQLQYSQNEAQQMVRKALADGQKVNSAEQLIELIFRNERQAVSR